MVNLHLGEKSSWKINGGGFAFDVEVGVPGLSLGSELGLSAGGGGFALDFVSGAQEEHYDTTKDPRFRGNSYRLYFAYAEAEIGVGIDLLGAVSVSGGTPDMYADGGYFHRVGLLAPDDSGEVGDPTGLLGPAATISTSVSMGGSKGAGYIICGPPVGLAEQAMVSASLALGNMTATQLLAFKYGAPYWGDGSSMGAGAGAALQVGMILGIQNRKNGLWVKRGEKATFLR